MKKQPIDVLLISLNDSQTDARSINFLETFRKLNLKAVGIFASSHQKNHLSSNQNFQIVNLRLSKSNRLTPKWIEFCTRANILTNHFAPEVVFAEDVYSLPIAYQFKRKFKSKIIYDSREIYSELASLRNKKYKKRIISKIEESLIPYVDTILVTGDLDKKVLSKKFTSSPIEVVYNYPPRAKKIHPIDFKKTLGLPYDSVILIYQGMILEGRGLELALNSLQYIDRAHLVILGEGEYSSKLRDFAKSLGLEHKTHFLGAIPYSELLSYTSGADIGFVLIEPISLSYKLALPNKLFEYCQAKIPIIATKLPAIESIFQKFKIGRIVHPDVSAENLSKEISLILEDRNSYLRELDKASHFFVWETQIPLIEQILTQK